MKNIVIMIFILTALQVNGQNFYTELMGFKLGQYRTTLTNELGKPFLKDKFEDGFEYETFRLKPDSSLYVVCEYAVNQTDIIWSIQVTGKDNSTDLGFNGLKFGIDKELLLQQFGKPSKIEDVGKYGQRWEYKNSNFSFEVNKSGRLSSIKISDRSSEFFKFSDLKKLPAFAQLKEVLQSDDNHKIADLLAPDIEIYRNGNIFSFAKSLKSEIQTDESKVFSLIKELAKDLSTVDVNNDDEYGESVRIQLDQDPKHVIKIKKGHQIKEIVLKYYWGKYVIWEISS